MTPTTEQVELSLRLMRENAFVFYELRETIKQDVRLFNAPVYIRIPFYIDYPVLGHFIRWWEESEVAHFVKDNRSWLVYSFAGSPMTGSSVCSAICEDGRTATLRGVGFGALRGSLGKTMGIDNDALNIPPSEQTFTLEQAVSFLQAQNPYVQSKIQCEYQAKQIAELREQCNDWERKYYQLLFKPHYAELQALLNRYKHLMETEYHETSDSKHRKTLKYYAETHLFDVLHHCYPEMITKRKDAQELIQPIEKYLLEELCTQQDADI